MKKVLVKFSAAALLVAAILPVNGEAQKVKEERREEKVIELKGEGNDEEHIVIIRKDGAKDKKTVVVMDGSTITVDGKELKDGEMENGTVRIMRHKDGEGPRINKRIFFKNDHPLMGFEGMGENMSGEKRALLGVSTENDEKGALVKSVTEASAAEKAKIQEGDIITKIDKETIDGPADLSEAIKSHKPGDKVTVHYLRNGKAMSTETELGEFEDVNMKGVFNFDGNGMEDLFNNLEFPKMNMAWSGKPKLGLSIEDLEEGTGVKITDIVEESAADRAGLQKGDIITKIGSELVNSTDIITEYVHENQDNKPIDFQVTRDGKTQNIQVKIPKKIKKANL